MRLTFSSANGVNDETVAVGAGMEAAAAIAGAARLTPLDTAGAGMEAAADIAGGVIVPLVERAGAGMVAVAAIAGAGTMTSTVGAGIVATACIPEPPS
ncbi:hypothetical protein [Mycobacterium botniense]|uniref:Uncharacterized protein n=1 Tax=Mycobacterium botniense TaxID=84962 RepID=A0A7I9XXW0_9MYCO|nr:hypothetical protein [Mycobacterium botniense]GFG74639.1 hypothetical protein MBOT_20040 [Mycobacterium botniense]